MITFSCECGKRYQVKDELAGKRAKCSCGNPMLIPQARVVSSDMRQTDSTDRAKKRHWIWAAGISAVLLIVMAGIFSLSSKRGHHQNAAPSERIAETESNAAEDPPRTSSAARLARILKDIEGHHEEEERSAPAGGGLLLISLPVAIEILKQTNYDTLTFSTQLSEAKLIRDYGVPDEVGEDSMQIQTGKFRFEKKKSRFIRYDWLKFMVTPEGEVWAIGSTRKAAS